MIAMTGLYEDDEPPEQVEAAFERGEKGVTAPPALPRVERAEDGYFLWFHECVDPEFNDIGAKLPIGPNGWQWTEDGGLTPSIWCHGCGTHGFWVGGEHPYWRSA